MINPVYDEVPGYVKGETWKKISIHNDYMILGFFGDYNKLSNMYPCKIEMFGYVFQSAENAYQGAKFKDHEEIFNKIVYCSPKQSKHYANNNNKLTVKNWKDIKLEVMSQCLVQKFSDKNPELKQFLISTGNKYLEETNWWQDQYWGVCQGKGENQLGKLLMRIRQKLVNT